MQVTNIFGKEFTTIASMKQFAIEQGMSITGSSKWVKAQWIKKLESFMEVQAEVIATAVDAEKASQEAAESVEVVALAIGSLVVAAITSEQAIAFYRGALKLVIFAIVIALMFTAKVVAWCWENRDRTAVYYWVNDAFSSRWGLRLRTELLGVALVASVGVDENRRKFWEVCDRALVRLGLGGVSIEIQ